MGGAGDLQVLRLEHLGNGPGFILPVFGGGLGREGFPEDELVDVPGEEEPDPGALGLLPGVLDHGLNVRATAVFLERELDFAGETNGLVFIDEGQVTALSGAGAALLTFSPGEGQTWGFDQDFIDPTCRVSGKFPFGQMIGHKALFMKKRALAL